MKQDFKRRIGHFFKRNDRLISFIDIRPYSFEDILDRELVGTDNPDKNIIYSRLHHEQELKGIREPQSLDDDLREVDSRDPVIVPADFTTEWEIQRRKASKKQFGDFDEEDALAVQELEDQIRADIERRKENSEPQKEAKPIPENEVENVAVEVHTVVAKPLGDQTPEAENLNAFENQKDNLDKMGEVLKGIDPETGEEQVGEENVGEDSVRDDAGESNDPPIDQPHQQVEKGDGNAALPGEHEDPARDYEFKEFDQNAVSEAKAKGYEDGFKVGEEKATLQFNNTTGKVITNIEEIIADLQNVKTKVLHNVQDNFFEVCQALAESLISREFSIDPNAFAAIVEKALDDTISKDEFKIAVHPEFFKLLQNIDNVSFKERLKEDESVTNGDFRIDSDLSVVDGNIKELITELLREADVSLFEKTEAS